MQPLIYIFLKCIQCFRYDINLTENDAFVLIEWIEWVIIFCCLFSNYYLIWCELRLIILCKKNKLTFNSIILRMRLVKAKRSFNRVLFTKHHFISQQQFDKVGLKRTHGGHPYLLNTSFLPICYKWNWVRHIIIWDNKLHLYLKSNSCKIWYRDRYSWVLLHSVCLSM